MARTLVEIDALLVDVARERRLRDRAEEAGHLGEVEWHESLIDEMNPDALLDERAELTASLSVSEG